MLFEASKYVFGDNSVLDIVETIRNKSLWNWTMLLNPGLLGQLQ